MDTSTYSDENLLDMDRKGIKVPESCRGRILRLRQERNQIHQGLTPKEAAHKLGPNWSAKKVRKLLRRSKIPGIKIQGRWYVRRDWLEGQDDDERAP